VVATSLVSTFALANEFKEGDLLVGGTRDDGVRREARAEVHGTRIGDIRRTTFVSDGVSDAIERSRDRSRDHEIDSLTIGDLRRLLLGPSGPSWAAAHAAALPSEVAAAVAKTMTDGELAAIASRLFNPLPGGDAPSHASVAIGSRGHLGSRIQPNSPGDDEEEILFSIFEGLVHGCGDVIVGLNPAADEIGTIVRLEALLERVVSRLELPTRYCVLSNIVKQDRAKAHVRIDVGFQSLAGTSTALAGMVGLDADGVLELARGFDGLYFETGQGSAVTNGAAEGVDMVTLEARAYGIARAIQRQTGKWTIVNDVAGFIGPEVFRTVAQLERACLEDLVMARLHGLTMGLDVCSTFHMGIAPNDLRAATARIVERAAPTYLMAVAGNADPMLGYLTTAFADHPRLRKASGRRIASAMQQRLTSLGATEAAELYAAYTRAGGDRRTAAAIVEDGRRRIAALQERGFDLGSDPPSSEARLERIFAHARRALYATVSDSVIRDACAGAVRVRTRADDRDDYLAHPPAGEILRAEDEAALRRLYPGRAPQVQVIVSDGLNAEAINEHLRPLLPGVRRLIADAGCHVGAADVVVQNGRVRAGYHAGAAIDPEVVVHIIGERPGTGLNTASAYLTYGRDAHGRSRWDPRLDHSCTTAVCGIHPRGKPPDIAAAEIARTVRRMVEERKSGVSL
jgi:ethanolamine ammonia-lyase large subunit